MPEIDSLLSAEERDILKVSKMTLDKAKELPPMGDSISLLDSDIEKTENILRAAGYGGQLVGVTVDTVKTEPTKIVVRSFEDLLREANEKYPGDISFSDIFTPEELAANREYIERLNGEFDDIHRLDETDM